MAAAGKMFDLFSCGAARRMRSHLDGIYTLRVSNHSKAPDSWKTMPINVKFHAFFNLSILECLSVLWKPFSEYFHLFNLVI